MHVQSEVLGKINVSSEFIGYSKLTADAKITVLLQNGNHVERVAEGDEIQFILDRTPFYAESGGQVADKGTISNESFVAICNRCS